MCVQDQCRHQTETTQPVGCGACTRECVRAHSLEVHVVPLRHVESVGHEVVLDGRVHLHDVAALPAHVHVVDVATVESGGARADREPVRSV